MSASRCVLAPLGLAVFLACTPTGGASGDEVARLAAQVESLQADVTALQSELAQVKEDLPPSRDDRLAERRERRRALSERERSPLPTPRTPDLRDPFVGNAPEPAKGPPTPLPLPAAAAPEPVDDAQALIDQAVSSIACVPGSCSLSAKSLEQLMANPEALSKQARVIPSVREGETNGYKLYGIRPRSLPRALGFKNGDLIRAINDEPLDSMDRAMHLYSQLRDAKSFTLLLERKGQLHTLELTFK